MTIQDETVTDGILLTETAAGKVKALLEQEGRDDLRAARRRAAGRLLGPALPAVLRRALARRRRASRTSAASSVVVDRMSAPYLSGATIDFVDTIEKQGFTIDNPNATGSCACGDSFHCPTRRPVTAGDPGGADRAGTGANGPSAASDPRRSARVGRLEGFPGNTMGGRPVAVGAGPGSGSRGRS